MPLTDRVREADAYLAARTGCYEWRCARYEAAATAIWEVAGLSKTTGDLFDVGAGATEFGQYLWSRGFRGRYWPVDACIDGVDLDDWVPPRRADWFVCLEVIEHLDAPRRLLSQMQGHADKGVIVSTPNPETTDVLGMDATHVTAVTREALEAVGFTVTERSFYGQPDDSLFGVWLA